MYSNLPPISINWYQHHSHGLDRWEGPYSQASEPATVSRWGPTPVKHPPSEKYQQVKKKYQKVSRVSQRTKKYQRGPKRSGWGPTPVKRSRSETWPWLRNQTRTSGDMGTIHHLTVRVVKKYQKRTKCIKKCQHYQKISNSTNKNKKVPKKYKFHKTKNTTK